MFFSEVSNFNDNKDMASISRYRYRKLMPSRILGIDCISYYDKITVKHIGLSGLTLIWNRIFNPEKPKHLRYINGSYHYGYSYEGEEDEEGYDEW